MTNPFGDVEREAEDERLKRLEMAVALDSMEVDVTSWEAGFLDRIIKKLRDQKLGLTQREIEILNQMCEQYGVG